MKTAKGFKIGNDIQFYLYTCLLVFTCLKTFYRFLLTAARLSAYNHVPEKPSICTRESRHKYV